MIRADYESKSNEEGLIKTIKPEDFGTKGYYQRQKKLIKKHLNDIEDIEWLFDFWLERSYGFRQFLWAHRQEDIDKAKKVMLALGVENLRKVLDYMSMDYWHNFCGWPDLLVYNDNELFFAEVKSSKDKLSEDQKNWLLGNSEHMGFTAKILKICRRT